MTNPIREKFESTQAQDSLEKFQGGYANPSVNREWEVWKRAWESCRQSESSAPVSVNLDPVLTPHEVEFVKNLFNTNSDSQAHLK
jgi:hypothetical protein